MKTYCLNCFIKRWFHVLVYNFNSLCVTKVVKSVQKVLLLETFLVGGHKLRRKTLLPAWMIQAYMKIMITFSSTKAPKAVTAVTVVALALGIDVTVEPYGECRITRRKLKRSKSTCYVYVMTLYCLSLSSWGKSAHKHWKSVNACGVCLVEVCLIWC